MWYRSTFTNKIVNSTSAFAIENIYGKGAFDKLITMGVLKLLENPSVIDVLRETDSVRLAVLRYQEIHKCSRKEAVIGVSLLRKDMNNHTKKRGKKPWKKNTAKTASTPNSQDTGK